MHPRVKQKAKFPKTTFLERNCEKGRSWGRGRKIPQKQRFFERKNEKGREERQFFVKNK